MLPFEVWFEEVSFKKKEVHEQTLGLANPTRLTIFGYSELSRVFATCLTSTRRWATGAGQRRVVQVATVCAADACMAALVVAGASETRRAVR